MDLVIYQTNVGFQETLVISIIKEGVLGNACMSLHPIKIKIIQQDNNAIFKHEFEEIILHEN